MLTKNCQACALFPLIVLIWWAGQGATAQVISSRYQEPYPTAASKKGLQVEWVDDALALGIKHAAINVDLTRLFDVHRDGANPTSPTAQGSIAVRRDYLAALDAQIKPLSDHGVLVNIILLAYESSDAETDQVMLHPQYDRAAPNHLSAFNTVTPEGRETFVALLEFLAERWSRPDQADGRVVGYILGNEVNSHWWWCNMGHVSPSDFITDYERTARLAYGAIRRQSSWARLYVSLEHHWNIRYAAGDSTQAFAGRAFLDEFAARCRANGDFPWHVAFHPYPENLFEPRFWNDQTATADPETPRITFKNLSQLPKYLQQDALRYQGEMRHIILSEQGFHTPDGPDGEAIQDEAFRRAYAAVDAEPAIDAFILHRHVDNAHEGGLRLGLRSNQARGDDPRPPKLIYASFREIDQP